MSFLSKVTYGVKKVDMSHKGGIVSHVVQKAEYLGASYLAGRVNTQYGDKAKYRDVEITYGGGLLLMIGSVLADVLGYGGGWACHANTVGTALVGVHVASLGAQHGMDARVSVKALPGKQPVVGAIPPAGRGKFLDLNEVNRLAHMNG